jgi:hypothetical protein
MNGAAVFARPRLFRLSAVTVASESAGMFYRERYEVEDGDNWVLRVDISTDGGKSWDETQEIRLQRVQ